VDALGHDYRSVVTAPTCTEKGYTTHTCVRCQDSYQDSDTAAIGHSYRSVLTPSTCSQEGSKVYTCKTCGHSYTEKIPTVDHSYVFGICSVCGAEDENYKPLTYYLVGNINGADYGCEGDYQNMGRYSFVDGQVSAIFSKDSYVFVKTEGNQSWFMTNGWQGMEATSVTLFNTTSLGSNADKLYVPANTYVTFTLEENANGTLTLSYAPGVCEHDYAAREHTEPTCVADGSQTYWCKLCWHTYQETIPATGVHKYVGGYCINGCEAAQLKFLAATLTLKVNLDINFKVSSDLLRDNGYEDPYVVFDFGGQTTVVRRYSVSGSYHSFAFEGTAPHRMNDAVKATLYATRNGVLYSSSTVSYSVATYCYNSLNNTKDESFKTLLVDLLNYGSVAQRYEKYCTDQLVNARLTAAQRELGTKELRPLNTVLNINHRVIDAPEVHWKGAGLVLDDGVTLRFKIAADDIEGLSVKITGAKIKTFTINAEDFVATDGGYYLYYSGMTAAQMSDTMYLTAYRNNEIVSNTISYSIESYAYSKIGASPDSLLAELLTEMIKYGDAVRVYTGQ
jgi:hypothetical protein